MEEKNNSYADDFWKEKETEYNGKIEYKTFTRLVGTLNEKKKELSGLLYIVDSKLVFEDFEKEGGFLGMLFKKSKSNYEKTIIIINLSDISGITQISQGTAAGRISGAPGPAKPISGFMKFFSIIVNEVLLLNGEGFYFEILDKTSLLEAVNKFR